MADEERISPEEKLLRAVEQGAAHKEAPAPAAADERNPAAAPGPGAAAAPSAGKSGFLELLELKVHELRERGLLPRFSGWRMDLALVNRALALAILFLFVLIGADWIFFKPTKLLRLPEGQAAAGTKPPSGQAAKAGEPIPLDYYTSLAQKRSLFQPYTPPPPPPTPEQKAAQPAASGAPANLKVVAIASTGQGFEAIIEDTGRKETFFVTQGGRLGDYQVESIDWDSVVISQGSQQWTLSR